MYNYLANIGILLGSYFLGLKFTLMINACINFYNETSKTNLYTLLTLMSTYFLGVWNTLFYCLLYCLFKIMIEYDNMIIYYNKIKNEYNEFMSFYEIEKAKNPDKIIREIEFLNRMISKYRQMNEYVLNQFNKFVENRYMTLILSQLQNINYSSYIDIINNKIHSSIELLNGYIDSNNTLHEYKATLMTYYDKLKEQQEKYNTIADENKDNIKENNAMSAPSNMDDMMNKLMKDMTNKENNSMSVPSNMDDMMNKLMKDMNISDDELKNFKSAQQPSIDELNKLIMSVNELQKISTEFKNLNPNQNQQLSKAQRKALKKLKKNM
jgi:hypothetical protein